MSPTQKLKSFLFVTILSTHVFCGCVQAQATFATTDDYEAESYISRQTVRTPRGLTLDNSGDILVVSRDSNQILAVFEEGGSVEATVVVDAGKLGLNHGLAYSNGYLYASNDSAVFRWSYQSGQRRKITGGEEVVIQAIPSGGNHFTRTLAIDPGSSYLYVSVGSALNADVDENRALIRRFNLTELPAIGFQFDAGEKFAIGVRNAVGLAFDPYNTLWGVDCGADALNRTFDGGVDIGNSNPADELIKFQRPNVNYGFPYCWTVGQLNGYQTGAQLAWPDYMADGVHDDNYCQSSLNNHPPTLPLAAHNAPLGIVFYDGKGCDGISGSFPCSMKGDAFVAYHGSNKIQPATGYKVVRIPINPQSQLPIGEVQDILFDPAPNTCATSPTTCLRPVDLVFNHNGHLIVTSDSSNEIFKIQYRPVSNVKRSLSFAAILGIVLFTLVAVGVLGGVIYKCCFRKRSEESYERDQI